ncbi:hypothetical protein S245_064864, partial [Arachis hypogaea]
IFWTYTPVIDIWSIGCIFAEMLNGKPLFSGKNVVHQLDLMTDLLGSPPSESIARVAANYVAMVPSGQVKKRKINAEKKRKELEKERAKDELLTRKRQNAL